ncbi:MAG TPA: polysaccharide deacetylase family protein [Stellaceae bacterium]|nr:polysaccharide deacetylase family protein [Stellaceae bacterium]
MLIATLALPLSALAQEPDRLPAAVELPILVYHHVVPGHGSALLHVTPEGFEQQLKYLQSNGYRSISFDDLADGLEHGAPLPARPVILSFDDGWQNQYQHAFPLLRQYGFAATFYVVTGYVDRPNFMSSDELKEMIAAGMTIGSHSHWHPALPTLGTGERLKDEVVGSKLWLEERLGVTVDTFAYPYGAYTAADVAAVKAAGYRTARTVDTGTHATADNLETLPAVIFPQYLNRYRGNVELTASR